MSPPQRRPKSQAQIPLRSPTRLKITNCMIARPLAQRRVCCASIGDQGSMWLRSEKTHLITAPLKILDSCIAQNKAIFERPHQRSEFSASDDLFWPKGGRGVWSGRTSKAAFLLNGNTGPKIGCRSIDKYAYFGISKQCGLSKP